MPSSPPSISFPATEPAGRRPVTYTSPADAAGPRVPLYAPEFAADPHHAYRTMRQRFGDLAPVELAPGVPATLVLGFEAAVRILHDSEHFPADPRTWQDTVPADSPILPMMRWLPAARYSTGVAHDRYRKASKSSIDAVDGHELRTAVARSATSLINGFCRSGTVDLVTEYARPLVFAVLNRIMGCSPEVGERVTAGMAARFDTVGAAEGMRLVHAALSELIGSKRAHPGDDATSRLLTHPHRLEDAEVLAQLMSFYGAGGEAQSNLITNTILLMLTDDRFGGGLISGSLSTRDALDDVLFDDPPMANFCTTYPRNPVLVADTWLPAHRPVLISLAAANTDPAVSGRDRTGNRSHLAWSAGPHSCPARSIAYLIVQDAIDHLLDALPDMELACPVTELRWRPGPFHRALTALPVTFRPAPPVTLP
ncbi:cytochrome P450 [Nocardia rhamnosiphila]|uniref:cytochrome P450 n=1 Tax=Nocardia rhamnosiphila TaxID=426716 RepID=UPI0004C39FC9|nr:cytochrome P450 [Nocardia rhamnosiphila]